MSNDSKPFAYDEVAYPAMIHRQTHPEQMASKAFLLGLSPPPPERCRVLELGCGDGANLAAMAVLYPECTYVGIDLSGAAIARGQALIADAGLTSVRLHAGSLTDIDASWGTFDYILAHGVYSWVPAPVREAVLRVAGELLAPQGVAFISYLALPGAHLRDLVRTIARFHTSSTHDPEQKVREGISIIGFFGRASTENGLYQQVLRAEFEKLRDRPEGGFYHDELSDMSTPFLLTDFCADARRHGLDFLTDAEYVESPAYALTDEAEKALAPLTNNRLLLEQYYDFAHGRRFRQTLLCRAGQNIGLQRERVRSLHLACAARPKEPPANLQTSDALAFESIKGSSFRCNHPLTKAIFCELYACYPTRLPYAEAVKRGLARLGLAEPVALDDEIRLHRYVARLLSPGLIEAHLGPLPSAVVAGERPVASPLAQAQVRRGDPTLFNLAGKQIDLMDPVLRAILLLLDGHHDRSALSQEVQAVISALQATNEDREGAHPLVPPDPSVIVAQLDQALDEFARTQLLLR